MTRKFTLSEQQVLDVVDGKEHWSILDTKGSPFVYKRRTANAIETLKRDGVLIKGIDSILRRNLAFGLPNGGLREEAADARN